MATDYLTTGSTHPLLIHGDASWSSLQAIARERLGLAALEAWEHGEAPTVETFNDLPLFQKG